MIHIVLEVVNDIEFPSRVLLHMIRKYHRNLKINFMESLLDLLYCTG